jgi:hypothetical protein
MQLHCRWRHHRHGQCNAALDRVDTKNVTILDCMRWDVCDFVIKSGCTAAAGWCVLLLLPTAVARLAYPGCSWVHYFCLILELVT